MRPSDFSPKRKRWLALGAGVLVLCAPVAGSCADAVPAQKAPAISIIAAKAGPITETVVVTGTLAAREEVLVAAEIEGLAVEAILAEEGDSVEAGQVLARLSRATLDTSLAQNAAQIARAEAGIAQAKSAIAEAEAAQVQAKAALGRTQSLKRSGFAATETLEQRQAASKQAVARLEQARQSESLARAEKALAEAQRGELNIRLARTEIKAPAAGLVSRRTARIGAIATGAGEPLFRIIRDGAIELEAAVPEGTLARLQPGMPAGVVTAARAAPFAARVRLVASEIDPATRLGRVRLAVDPAPGLVVGAFGRAMVTVASRTGVLVPQSAVLYSAGGAEIQVVENDTVETRKVTVGLRTEQQAEIVSGLREGETVVATAGTFVRNGDKVTPVQSPAN